MDTSDKQLSELISKSMRGQLNSAEEQLVRQHVESNPAARAFAELSQAIQNSVSEVGALSAAEALSAEDAGGVGPGLSGEARQRMNDSIRMELAVRSSASLSGMPASSAGAGDSANQELDRSTDRSGYDATMLSEGRPGEDEEQREVATRYSIVRRLGQGGLGNVWLARDEKLRRNVAIKELNRQALEHPKSWQRFHREAEITGHLEHPNVVPLYQFGYDRKSTEPFYAMRFVGKRTLYDAVVEHREKVAGGEDPRLGLHRLLNAFLDVCQAIAYAHSRGVIHRDLKPENVALDNFGQVIVLDWGLAKLVEDGELSLQLNEESQMHDSALAQTMAGEIIGTPMYMAPEQAAGDLDSVDERTDVYGLGAILFTILTGNPPHANSASGSGAKGSTLKEILQAIKDSHPPKARDFADCVPRELEKICLKAMASKPFMRYESATELAESVERWMVGQNQQKSAYENMRMQCRELKASLQSAVRDLETNVRFMSSLPPIQELISADSAESTAAWRDRLATIFAGLLGAKSYYRSIAYCRIEDREFTELVRVERQRTATGNIRNIPKSRLRTAGVSPYMELAFGQKPDEVLSSLVCDPLCELLAPTDEPQLVSSVPIFDQKTEDAFGLVMIDCDIDAFLRDQLQHSAMEAEVVIACEKGIVMLRRWQGRIDEDSRGQELASVAPRFQHAAEQLETHAEFLDETDAEIYGTRLWLVPRRHGITYLVRYAQSGG